MKKTKTTLRDKDALGYLQNAKELLNKSEIKNDTYIDIKYVREACGTAYLAVLKAIDSYLDRRGVGKKELPRSVESYRDVLFRYASIHNGRLLSDFDKLYDELHIAGYYRGLIYDVNVLKVIFKTAERFIKMMS
ncbi:MAG: DUF5618 family protein [Ignavibacteriae bacterium]|nr:DUF5618 family protein [Ignavibacteriota bacterium]